MMRRTNSRQFTVMILGLRKPVIGEQFEIEVRPPRGPGSPRRYEVECVDVEGDQALVERLDNGPTLNGTRSRVISDKKPRVVKERSDYHTYSQNLMEELRQEEDLQDFDGFGDDGF